MVVRIRVVNVQSPNTGGILKMWIVILILGFLAFLLLVKSLNYGACQFCGKNVGKFADVCQSCVDFLIEEHYK
jgi:hypothetical protein